MEHREILWDFERCEGNQNGRIKMRHSKIARSCLESSGFLGFLPQTCCRYSDRERFKVQVLAVKRGTPEVIIAVGFIATVMDTASESVHAVTTEKSYEAMISDEAFDVWDFHGFSSKAEWILDDLGGLLECRGFFNMVPYVIIILCSEPFLPFENTQNTIAGNEWLNDLEEIRKDHLQSKWRHVKSCIFAHMQPVPHHDRTFEAFNGLTVII